MAFLHQSSSLLVSSLLSPLKIHYQNTLHQVIRVVRSQTYVAICTLLLISLFILVTLVFIFQLILLHDSFISEGPDGIDLYFKYNYLLLRISIEEIDQGSFLC